jgi:hypothetical protein
MAALHRELQWVPERRRTCLNKGRTRPLKFAWSPLNQFQGRRGQGKNTPSADAAHSASGCRPVSWPSAECADAQYGQDPEPDALGDTSGSCY